MPKLMDLVLSGGIGNWDWVALGTNPNMSIDDLQIYDEAGDYTYRDFDIKYLSSILSISPHIDINYVITHPEYPWTWQELSKHRNITMDDIIKYKHLPWNPIYIIENPNLTEEYVLQYLLDDLLTHKCLDCEKKCNCYKNYYNYLSLNHNLSIQFIDDLEKKGIITEICMNDIISHPKFTLDLVWQKNYYCKDIFQVLHTNPNLTIDFILENADEKWNWDELTIHPNIKISDIKNNKLPWAKN